jgi:hypothetical protein
MKKWLVISMVILLMFTLVGCGRGDMDNDTFVPPVVEKPEDEPITEIIGGETPTRDPFATGRDYTDWDKETGDVDADGRDPFASDLVGSDWVKESGNVSTDGRDPFRMVAGVGDPEPVDPVDPEPVDPEPVEPVDPEPVDPEPVEPVDPGVPSGVILVQARTLDRCWLDVFVDGERVLRTNVPVDRDLEWSGNEVLLAQVGRDYALEVTVNGKNLGVLIDLVERMSNGVYVDQEAGVRISLERQYDTGVLVNLRFTPLN